MSKRIISLVAIMLMAAILLCGCGRVSLEDLNVPSFEDDQSMVIATWTGSMANWTSEQFDYLQNAYVNLLVGVSEHVQYSDFFFDMAEKTGFFIPRP